MQGVRNGMKVRDSPMVAKGMRNGMTQRSTIQLVIHEKWNEPNLNYPTGGVLYSGIPGEIPIFPTYHTNRK